MARGSISTTHTSNKSHSETNTTSKSQSSTQSQSESKKVLDEALRDKILSGLMGYMTDEEINAYAENLLRPQLNAGLEAAEQQYSTTELAKRQEIENLAAALDRGIEEQENAYAKSRASLETAALARGMGRSSYTLSTLANADSALAKAIENLTTDTGRQQGQIQAQITQAAQQKAQTTGRLNTDYASNLAAKVQELKEQQRQEYNQNYLTAVSGAMGTASTGSQNTQGSSESHSVTDAWSKGFSQTVTKSLGGGGGSDSWG
jgi:uncharacterized membrane protein YgcG